MDALHEPRFREDDGLRARVIQAIAASTLQREVFYTLRKSRGIWCLNWPSEQEYSSVVTAVEYSTVQYSTVRTFTTDNADSIT